MVLAETRERKNRGRGGSSEASQAGRCVDERETAGAIDKFTALVPPPLLLRQLLH